MRKVKGEKNLKQGVREGWISEITEEMLKANEEFRTKISPSVIQNLRHNGKWSPFIKQLLPAGEEIRKLRKESRDPIGDKVHEPIKGIIHRYPDRVLLMPTNICAVHCRYCFRRARVGKSGGELKSEQIEKALAYIRDREEIWEVILSGGDPLMLSDRRLATILSSLREIAHVKVLRVHTRVPIVAPERITNRLTEILRGREPEGKGIEKPLYVMLHCNHAQELTDEARRACAMLVDSGLPLLSQSVLLKGVNDTAEALRALMRALVETRIKPHYLHHGDLAEGTSHFRTTIEHGQSLLRQIRGNLSGLCQPTYMLDLPGGHGKIPIGPVYITKEKDEYSTLDHQGRAHGYKDRR